MTGRLRVGLVVDVGKRQLLLRGQPLQVHLSPQEFDLLHLLWEKAGEVCASDEVCDRLWPDEESHTGRQQDLHQVVRHVRRKLEPHVGSGVIENVPRVGYRLGLEVRAEEEEELPAPRRLGNLPVELTSFVGRADEIRMAGESLSAARLLTLTGIGGGGKTRLALKVAEEQQESYPDGVWLVELASLSDSSLVDKEVTSTIGSFDKESLADKRLLLILDNCEHLLDSCAQTAVKVLQQAPLSRILATSREPLGVPGEVIHRVPPLSIPSSTDLPPDSLSAYEAVSLFVDRARSAEPNFALTEATG
ncbi:MAG: winged helix-turn-helix domain-containing protein, partial [Dehalococcoidia bacterium]